MRTPNGAEKPPHDGNATIAAQGGLITQTKIDRRRLLGGIGALALAGVLPGGRMAGQEPAATPVTAVTPAPFSPLLGLVPDLLAEPRPPFLLASFADLAAQTAASGIAVPAGLDDFEAARPWLAALAGLPLPPPYPGDLARSQVSSWEQDLGYGLTSVDQTLIAGVAPGQVTLLRGRFTRDRMLAAWRAAGFVVAEVEGVPVATLEPVPAREVPYRYAQAGLLDDTTLALAQSREAIDRLLQAGTPSLAAAADVAALAAAGLPPLAGGMLMRPAAGSDATPAPDASPLRLSLFGITPGGAFQASVPGAETEGEAEAEGATPAAAPTAARLIVALLLTEPEDAVRAAAAVTAGFGALEVPAGPRTVTAAEVFPEAAVTVAERVPVVILDLPVSATVAIRPGFWLQPGFLAGLDDLLRPAFPVRPDLFSPREPWARRARLSSECDNPSGGTVCLT